MRGDPGFFDVEERLKELSVKGDDLERLKGIVDFEMFRADLERAVPRADRAKGGLPIPMKPPVCNGMIAPRDSRMMPPPCNEMIPPGAPRLLAE